MEELAGPTGLEPATSGVTGLRSNQLSYDPEFVPGRGPREEAEYTEALSGCKAVVGGAGIEPATCCV